MTATKPVYDYWEVMHDGGSFSFTSFLSALSYCRGVSAGSKVVEEINIARRTISLLETSTLPLTPVAPVVKCCKRSQEVESIAC